jgi:hypothetical protein
VFDIQSTPATPRRGYGPTFVKTCVHQRFHSALESDQLSPPYGGKTSKTCSSRLTCSQSARRRLTVPLHCRFTSISTHVLGTHLLSDGKRESRTPRVPRRKRAASKRTQPSEQLADQHCRRHVRHSRVQSGFRRNRRHQSRHHFLQQTTEVLRQRLFQSRTTDNIHRRHVQRLTHTLRARDSKRTRRHGYASSRARPSRQSPNSRE